MATTKANYSASHIGAWLYAPTRQAIYHRDGDCCIYCGVGAEDGNALSVDHYIPIQLGGDNRTTNLITACISCNSAKQDKNARDWFAYLRAMEIDTAKLSNKVRKQLQTALDMKEGNRREKLRVKVPRKVVAK